MDNGGDPSSFRADSIGDGGDGHDPLEHDPEKWEPVSRLREALPAANILM
jgi:hypothetical protein